jgi:hypothetical protein
MLRIRRFTTVAVMLPTLAAALLVGSSALASTDTGGFMAFGGNSSQANQGWCMENDSGSLYIKQCAKSGSTFDTSSAQDFVLAGNGLIHSYINGVDQGCLDILGNNPAGQNGTGTLLIYNGSGSCSTSNQAEVWTFSNGHLIPANHSGYCVDINGGSESSGTVVDITSCNGTPAQMFLPINFSTQIHNEVSSGNCLDVLGNGTCDGLGGCGSASPVDYTTCNTTSAQWFQFQPNGTASYHATMYGEHSGDYIGWDQTNGDQPTLSGIGSQSYEAWEYSTAQLLSNSDTVNGNSAGTCMDLTATPQLEEKNCSLLDQGWNIEIVGL